MTSSGQSAAGPVQSDAHKGDLLRDGVEAELGDLGQCLDDEWRWLYVRNPRESYF